MCLTCGPSRVDEYLSWAKHENLTFVVKIAIVGPIRYSSPGKKVAASENRNESPRWLFGFEHDQNQIHALRTVTVSWIASSIVFDKFLWIVTFFFAVCCNSLWVVLRSSNRNFPLWFSNSQICYEEKKRDWKYYGYRCDVRRLFNTEQRLT